MHRENIFKILPLLLVFLIQTGSYPFAPKNLFSDIYNHGPYEFYELKNGNLLLITRSDRPIFTIFDKEFNPVGESSTTAKESDQYGIIPLQNGGFYIYFRDCDISTIMNETWYGQLFNERCQPVGSAQQLFDHDTYGDMPTIIPREMPDGEIFILWNSWFIDQDIFEYYARVINPETAHVSDAFLVSENIAYDDAIPISKDRLILCAYEPNRNAIYDINTRKIVGYREMDGGFESGWDNFRNIKQIKQYSDNQWMVWWQTESQNGQYYFDSYLQLYDSNFQSSSHSVFMDSYQVFDGINIDIRYHFWWTPLPYRGFLMHMDKNNNEDMRDLHDFTSIFFNLDGAKVYQSHLGFYDDRLIQVREPEILNDDEIVYFWQEKDPYIDAFRMYVQRFDIETGQALATCRHDGMFYDYPGIFNDRILILTEDEDKNVVKKYVPAEPRPLNLQDFQTLSPGNDEVVEQCRPFLSWTQAVTEELVWMNEVEYFIYLDTLPDFDHARLIRVWGDTLVKTPMLEKGKTYFYKVLAQNTAQEKLWSSDTKAFFVSYNAIDDGRSFGTTWFDDKKPPILFERHEQSVNSMQLLQNYPNPFNMETYIRYTLPEDGQVTLAIFDIVGRRVMVLQDGFQTAGYYSENWAGVNASGRLVSSGIYFCHLTFKGQSGSTKQKTLKMSLIR